MTALTILLGCVCVSPRPSCSSPFPLSVSRSLVSVLSLLLVHSSMRAYKRRLLASLLRAMLDTKLFTAPASGTGCDRPLLYGLLFAVLSCCDASDWAPADQVSGDGDNQSHEATVQLVEQWTADAEKAAAEPAPLPLLLPRAVAVYLSRHLVEAQLAKKPAARQFWARSLAKTSRGLSAIARVDFHCLIAFSHACCSCCSLVMVSVSCFFFFFFLLSLLYFLCLFSECE